MLHNRALSTALKSLLSLAAPGAVDLNQEATRLTDNLLVSSLKKTDVCGRQESHFVSLSKCVDIPGLRDVLPLVKKPCVLSHVHTFWCCLSLWCEATHLLTRSQHSNRSLLLCLHSTHCAQKSR